MHDQMIFISSAFFPRTFSELDMTVILPCWAFCSAMSPSCVGAVGVVMEVVAIVTDTCSSPGQVSDSYHLWLWLQ